MANGELGLSFNTKLNSIKYAGETYTFDKDSPDFQNGLFKFTINGMDFTVKADGDGAGEVTIRGNRSRLEQFRSYGAHSSAYIADVDDDGDAINHTALKCSSSFSAKNIAVNQRKAHKVFKPLDDWLKPDASTIHALTATTPKHQKIKHHDSNTLKRDLKPGVTLKSLRSHQHQSALAKLAYMANNAKGKEQFKPEDYDFVFQDIQEDRLASYIEHARRILKKIELQMALEFAAGSNWNIATAPDILEAELGDDDSDIQSTTSSVESDDSFDVISMEPDTSTRPSLHELNETDTEDEEEFSITTPPPTRMTAARRNARQPDPTSISRAPSVEVLADADQSNTVEVEINDPTLLNSQN